MEIEDTPVAKDEAEDSEQAVNALVRVLEDLERHPDVAVYHGIGFEFHGHSLRLILKGGYSSLTSMDRSERVVKSAKMLLRSGVGLLLGEDEEFVQPSNDAYIHV